MKQIVIYVHGMGGSAAEAQHYQQHFSQSEVIGFDYQAQNPWEAKLEFPRLFDLHTKGCDSVILIANSIGAYLSMSALSEKPISKALFISPIVNMERLIADMMRRAGISEEELRRCGEISTDFGETLSWDYLCYVRKYPIRWSVPTNILYGKKDSLTSMHTVSEFADSVGASLCVMQDGEHWFHTDAQMRFLDQWIADCIR